MDPPRYTSEIGTSLSRYLRREQVEKCGSAAGPWEAVRPLWDASVVASAPPPPREPLPSFHKPEIAFYGLLRFVSFLRKEACLFRKDLKGLDKRIDATLSTSSALAP